MDRKLTPKEVAKYVDNTRGYRPDIATCWRWMVKGVKAGGDVIRLDHDRVGRRLFASTDDIERFFRDLKTAQLSDPNSSVLGTSTKEMIRGAETHNACVKEGF